ncbi:UNVERIFIED_CONTAM: hypothetical protein GTU68_029125 [Idotea baltica]|nr:hypothetical protein [Idotea baltica]
MRNISAKPTTLRIATAEAIVTMRPDSIAVIQDNSGPKPDVLPTARAAAFLAVKNTPSALPHCHPIPIEAVRVDYEFLEDRIRIEVEVQTIYKTGVEVEAMHGATLAALTIYDMMKPVDKGIELQGVRLLKKTGGKSDWQLPKGKDIHAAILVCSDAVVSGRKEDSAGQYVRAALADMGVHINSYNQVGDGAEAIRATVEGLLEQSIDLLITVGGTGLQARDQTPEAILPILDTEVPGIMEAARNYGQDRTPKAMVSRGLAGIAGNTLVIALPGSTAGARESVAALFPATLHLLPLQRG